MQILLILLRAHNPEVACSNPTPATEDKPFNSDELGGFGDVSTRLKTELNEADKHLNLGSGEQLLAKLWWENPNEVLKAIPDDVMSSDLEELEKLKDKQDSDLWDEFNIFFKPFVIDRDNQVTVLLDDDVLFKGRASKLFDSKAEFEDESEVDVSKIKTSLIL